MLSRKWTLGGIVVLLGAFFTHPETCISSKDILSFLAPTTSPEALSHYGMIAGTIILALGESLVKKTSTDTVNIDPNSPRSE